MGTTLLRLSPRWTRADDDSMQILGISCGRSSPPIAVGRLSVHQARLAA
jgi:hypothetical protein